jgi:hypothetical protein
MLCNLQNRFSFVASSQQPFKQVLVFRQPHFVDGKTGTQRNEVSFPETLSRVRT